MSEQKSSYTFEDLIECAKGRLFGPGNAQLPLPPMLMFDRILKISETGGQFDKGEIIEQGTHEELTAKEGGLYAKLIKMQTEMQSIIAIGG